MHAPALTFRFLCDAHDETASSQDYRPPDGPPPSRTQDDTLMSVDPNPGSQRQRCLIPNCPYSAFFNVAEEEQTEYCGQGHELCVLSHPFVAPRRQLIWRF
jgi:hypothetical protein